MKMPWTIAARWWWCVLVCACHDTCPAGYRLYENTCVVANIAGSSNSQGGMPIASEPTATLGGTGTRPSPESVAGASNGGAPVAVTSGCQDESFGRTCLSAADCGCDTDYCAAYPGQPGLCTHTGCLGNTSICPATWGCMDLSSIQPGLPSICTPPP
jgi:hypothetical protein